MIKGILKAISIKDYGIFTSKSGKKSIYKFRVNSSKKRKKIDSLQGQVVDLKKDIEPLLK